MVFVSVILVFFYVIAFSLAKMMYLLFHRPTKHTDSYWQSHIEKHQKIDYASAY